MGHFAATLLIVLLTVVVLRCDARWVNTQVTRTIDLKTQVVKTTISATMKNEGPFAANSFELQVDTDRVSNLAYLHASLDDDTQLTVKEKSTGVYHIDLPKAVAAGDSIKVRVEEYFTRLMQPFPEEITQTQKQLVKYHGNHLFYSPYVTESQTTTVELFSNVIEYYSKFGTSGQQGTTIKYGGSDEYNNVKALSHNPMILHFENNSPFLVVTKMTRVIEVSHWGNIAVEETFNMLHTGAKFKGSFSRYDYLRLPTSGLSAVKSFKTILPASARDVYYRDAIGNISTSRLLVLDDSVELDIRPRFPLFGGWKTHYYLGYDLPSYTYLYKTGDLLALRMRFVDHIFDDMVIDDLTVKIILPESSNQVSVNMPYDVERLPDALHFTYLDTIGRPVIAFRKRNVIEQHIQDFTLSYNFDGTMLLMEPLLVVGAFFLLFITVIIIGRLDFSITHDKFSEARMRAEGVIVQIQEQQAKRSKVYSSLESAIKAYKSSKNSAAFSASRKAIDKSHKESSATLTSLISQLASDSSEIHERAVLMMKTNQELIGKYQQSVQLAEKLMSGRLKKDQYINQNDRVQCSIDHLKEKLESMCDSL